jgi:hypothetical protein
MLHYIITLLLSLGATVNPEITEQEAKIQLEEKYQIVLTDERPDDWGY